jgi:hypothetical protein
VLLVGSAITVGQRLAAVYRAGKGRTLPAAPVEAEQPPAPAP